MVTGPASGLDRPSWAGPTCYECTQTCRPCQKGARGPQKGPNGPFAAKQA